MATALLATPVRQLLPIRSAPARGKQVGLSWSTHRSLPAVYERRLAFESLTAASRSLPRRGVPLHSDGSLQAQPARSSVASCADRPKPLASREPGLPPPGGGRFSLRGRRDRTLETCTARG